MEKGCLCVCLIGPLRLFVEEHYLISGDGRGYRLGIGLQTLLYKRWHIALALLLGWF